MSMAMVEFVTVLMFVSKKVLSLSFVSKLSPALCPVNVHPKAVCECFAAKQKNLQTTVLLFVSYASRW